MDRAEVRDEEDAIQYLTALGWTYAPYTRLWESPRKNAAYYTFKDACNEEGIEFPKKALAMKAVVANGKRHWPTGAVRSQRKPDHGAYELLPVFALQQLAIHINPDSNPTSAVANGEYDPRNWELGIPDSSWFDSAMSHLIKWAQGDTSEDHLRAAMWNVTCAVDTRERIKLGLLPKTLHDMPQPLKGE